MKNITSRLSDAAMIALAILPAIALSTAAHAQTSVKVGDLNLASAAGKAAYSQRLDTAARHFCGRETTLDLQAACKAGVQAEVNGKLSATSQMASRI